VSLPLQPSSTVLNWWKWKEPRKNHLTNTHTRTPGTCLLQAKDKDSPQVEQLMSRMAILESDFGQDA